jgi:hypothetical protein
MLRAALSLCAASAAFAAASSVAPLALLPNSTLGRCLDGTPSGFYFLNQSSTRWVVHLDGGGECNSAASCAPKVATALGSSRFFAPSANFDDAGAWFLDTDAARNPGFASWNKVRVPYCTQDLHMGTVSAPTPARLAHSISLHRLLTTMLTWLRPLFTISPIWYVYAGPKSRFSSHTATPVASSTS